VQLRDMIPVQTPELKILQQVADKLGLRLVPRGFGTPYSLTGEVDGHPIKVNGVVGEDSVRFGLWVSFVPPLDLGLQVSRRGTLSMIGEGFRQLSEFELQFEVEADERSRAEALMVPALQSALLSRGAVMEDLGLASSVIGEGHGGLPGLPKSAQVIEALQNLVQVAVLVEQSCLKVPEASGLSAHARQWSALASRHELELLRTPLQLKGSVRRSQMLACARRTDRDSYCFTLSAGFETPLGFGLSVRPEGISDKLLHLVKSDIRLGEADFDSLYRVTATLPSPIPGILDAEVRAPLSRLARKGLEVHLSDESITMSLPSNALSPEAFVEVFEEVAVVADRLQENALGTGQHGPYR